MRDSDAAPDRAPAVALAARMEEAAAAAREAAPDPCRAGALLEALMEMGGCLEQAERMLRGGGAEAAAVLGPVLRQWQPELRRLAALAGGALELAGGWNRAAGFAAGYGEAAPAAGRTAVRVDETA
ncbi:MAG: hypothetical protein NZR01_07045 [Bryobacteraceae bacterium]|nr:hypothetical protein [Bryobacteraceae bacterium]